MKNGQLKGRRAENEVCMALSRWHNPKLSKNASVYDVPFRRRITAGLGVEGHWEGKGDILHRPGIRFPFTVEVKHYGSFTLDGLFDVQWDVWDWWTQAKEQAAEAKSTPLLFIRRNLRQPPWLVMAHVVTLERLAATDHLTFQRKGVALLSLEALVARPFGLTERIPVRVG